MNAIKIIVGAALVIHIVLSIPVIIADPGLGTFMSLLSERETWGFQIFSDLVLSFIVIGTLIYLIEGSWKTALMWFVAINILGNPVSAIYVLINMNKIQARLSPPTAQTVA